MTLFPNGKGRAQAILYPGNLWQNWRKWERYLKPVYFNLEVVFLLDEYSMCFTILIRKSSSYVMLKQGLNYMAKYIWKFNHH